MRVFLLFLFFTGVVLVVVNQVITAPKVKVEYRYLPRDLDTYLREEDRASVRFDAMFNKNADELWLTQTQ